MPDGGCRAPTGGREFGPWFALVMGAGYTPADHPLSGDYGPWTSSFSPSRHVS
jgi:hypothetical protein